MSITPRFKRVLLFGHHFPDEFRIPFRLMMSKIRDHKVECHIYKPLYDKVKGMFEDEGFDGFFVHHGDLTGQDEVMLSLGGDGTYLEAVTFVRERTIPIAGINIGRLGFLAAIGQDEITTAVDSILQGFFEIEQRALIRVETEQALFGDFNFALNEITVHKRDDASMITIHVWLDGRFLNSYWADGLIVATPTGSTAYSLSVGGPLVLPGTGTFLLSPIAPHNLTVRPLVYKDTMTLTLKMEGRSGKVLVSADSRSVVVDDHVELKISRAPFNILIPRLKNHDFFQTLRGKLMWGADKRNWV